MFIQTSFAKRKSLLREGVSMLLMHVEGKPAGTEWFEAPRGHPQSSSYKCDAAALRALDHELDQGGQGIDTHCTPEIEAEWRKVLHAGVHFIAIQGAKAA